MSTEGDPAPAARSARRQAAILAAVVVAVAALSAAVAALLVNIFERKQEARNPYLRFVNVTEDTTDPAEWGRNWPRQYDGYRRTAESSRVAMGVGDADPAQKAVKDPWLTRMFAGHAFAIDYREHRGHYYMLSDQDATRRVKERPQPGACLHCHSSSMPLYRALGEGDVMKGFEKACAMPWAEARNYRGRDGRRLVEHPVSCVDCHDPNTMALRITRPAFMNGIRALKKHEGAADYDVNRDATRQEMRSYVCAQCHVEYYFRPADKLLVYPWHHGVKVEEMEKYYDEIGFSDWKHAETGAPVLKAQHPEFEMWRQGVHARSGVACADCHMPYMREGAMKVSDHWVRTPLLNIARACQTCHHYPETELRQRVEIIQSRNYDLMKRAAAALVDMLDAVKEARAAGAADEQLAAVWRLQRKAQWRLDFIVAENSMGFHAPQETARILAEAADYARQGQLAAVRVATTRPAR